MLKLTRSIFSFGVVATLIACVAGCGTGASVVARVGSVSITKAELDHWTALEVATGGEVGGEDAAKARALALLISSRWTFGEARELGLRVSDGAVRRRTAVLQFQRRLGTSLGGLPREAELTRFLARLRVGLADQEWLVRLELLDAQIERAWTAQATKRVTHAQVIAYYKHHRRRFLVSERREVAIIETNDERPLNKARREIESGSPFASVARRTSVDPRARNGRTLIVARDEGVSPLLDAIFSAKPHVLVGPLQVALAYLFEVLRVMPAHELPLRQTERTIVQTLAAHDVQSVTRKTFQRKWAKRTVCASSLVARGCGTQS